MFGKFAVNNAISLLREIGIEFVTVIDWRDEEITNAEKEFPGQVYELIKAHPVKDELQIAHKLDALIVHTILQHLNDEQLNLFLANMRRIVKDGAVMILIFKSMPKKGSLRNYLDRIGQKKARINDVATGDVTIWEEKLGLWRDLHLWAPDQVLKIAKNNGWTLIKETLQTPAKITFTSDSRKMEHCVYFLKAVPIEEGGN